MSGPGYTPAQCEQVRAWLKTVAYKPGTSFEAVHDELTGSIRVFIDALVFDSTHPKAVRIVRNQSVRVALPAHLPITGWRSEEVIENAWYEVGPDLVGGQLIRVGKSSTMPPFLSVPIDSQRPEAAKVAKDAFLRWLKTELHELEYHEADEWFRDAETGKVFFDPHG